MNATQVLLERIQLLRLPIHGHAQSTDGLPGHAKATAKLAPHGYEEQEPPQMRNDVHRMIPEASDELS